MIKKKIKEIKLTFEKKKKELEADIALKSNSELDIAGDEVDAIQGTQISSVLSKLSEREIIQLGKINKALEKISNGSFGECEECGEDIPEKRLLAKPDATTCVFCAEKLEKLAKTYRK